MESLDSGPPQPAFELDAALESAREAAVRDRIVVLVEGESDAAAVATLAERLGIELGERASLVSMGGVTNAGRFLELLGPRGLGARVAGLCDAGEESLVRRALERSGFGVALDRADMARLGFHVCVSDLEDELIRAAGVESVLEVARQHGELASFRTFQKQAPWRDREPRAQLARWIASKARRKLGYARLLVHAMELERAPKPLSCLLEQVNAS